MDDDQTETPTTDTEEISKEETSQIESSSDNPEVQSRKKKRKLPSFLKNKKIMIPAVLVIIFGISGAIYYFARPSKQQSAATNITSTNEQKVKVEEAKKLGEVQFLETAKKIGNLNFFIHPEAFFGESCAATCEPVVKADAVQYYQIGISKDGREIIAFLIENGIDSSEYYALGKDGKYEVLGRASSNLQGIIENTDTSTAAINDEYLKNFKAALAPNVSLNTTDTLSFPEFPSEVTVGGQKLTTSYGDIGYYRYFMADGLDSLRGSFLTSVATLNTTKLETIGNITFYRVIVNDQPTYQAVEVRAAYKNLFGVSYLLNGELSRYQEKPIEVTWIKGVGNNSAYFSASGGCGSADGFVIAKGLNKAELSEVGKSKQGQKLYQLPLSNSLVKELYEKDYAGGEFVEDNTLKKLTLQQFTDQHAYFLVENAFGDFMVMQRNDMFIRGGCAKPVVYLYPTYPMSVDVSVGANVTLSDPLYPSNGWQDVFAEPAGRLTYMGRVYSSLFWEGYGHGEYPEIRSGTVVASVDALDTIRVQLKQQGLNERELDDFVEFWQYKIPSKPYTRLTWLTKAELDRLAPLSINPRPTTTIRVFLDMEGLDKSVNLPKQQLRAPVRNGFTLVEWGGLARDGSVPAMR